MEKKRFARLRRITATRWIDLFLAVTVTVFFIVAWSTLHLTHVVPAGVAPFIAALAAVPVLLARLEPMLGWAVSAGSALVIALAIPHQPGNDLPFQVVHILALLTLVFAVALRAPGHFVGVVWLATSLLFGTTMSGSGVAVAWGWPIGLAGLVLVALLIRWLASSRAQLLRQEEQNELERARRAILEEKARIARDLHDVVAHHMSLVVVQAQTAPYRVDDAGPAARAEFDSIGATAREALNEIRGMLGVLRSDGRLPEHSPQPVASDVLALFDAARRAGVGIEWTVTADLAAVGDTIGLTLYRIVQESLSNASRHAPGAAVHVSIGAESGPDDTGSLLRLRLTNTAPTGPALPATGGGHGITGMRARAVAVGGEVEAGALPDGGFAVEARLPLTALATTGPTA